MRKYISVMGLSVRPVLLLIAILLCLSAALQFFFFTRQLSAAENQLDEIYSQYMAAADSEQNDTGDVTYQRMSLHVPSLSNIINMSHTEGIFCISLIIIWLILALSLSRSVTKSTYTISRLSVTRYVFYGCAALIYTVIIAAVIALEAVLCYAFGLMYGASACGELTGHQAILLSFYENRMLHSLIPLAAKSRFIRNCLLVICSGICASCLSYSRLFTKKISTPAIFTGLIMAWFFPSNLGSIGSDALISSMAVMLTCFALYGISEVKDSD